MSTNPTGPASGGKSFTAVILVAVAFITLMVPAFWMSWHTPFSLVDDLHDGTILDWTRKTGQFGQWVRSTFVTAGDTGRYRPLFELGNFVTWAAAGPHAGWHHLLRWLEWAIGLYFWNKALLQLIKMRHYRLRLQLSEYSVLLPLLVFNTFVCFSPNQPMARLAPQELYSFVFLGMLCYGAMRWIANPAVPGTGTSRWPCLLALGVGYLGLSLSKETNISLMAFFAVFLFLQALHRRSRGTILAFLSATSLLVYTLWRIKMATGASSYGQGSITLALIEGNIRWLVDNAFQFATLPIITLLLMAGIAGLGLRYFRDLHHWGAAPGQLALFFSMGSTAALIAILLVSWQPIPRYYYPLVPLLGWLLAQGVIELDRRPSGTALRRGIRVTVMALALWFITANYFNYLMQFAAQYHARQVESRMLDAVRTRLLDGRQVAVVINPNDTAYEMCASTQLYFGHFLPAYRNEHWTLKRLNEPLPEPGLELISPHDTPPGWVPAEVIAGPDSYPALDAVCRVSAMAQGRRYPHLVLDAGVHDFSYRWTFYRPAGGTGTP